MKPLFYKFVRNIFDSFFKGYNLLWHLLTIILTYIIVVSDFDWTYFSFFQHSLIYPFFFLGAALLGAYLPIFVPLGMLAIGFIRKSKDLINSAWALGQAGLLGLLVTSFYKVFTGRPSPLNFFTPTTTDISKIFKFGILQGGVFTGWPSSHTAAAFAIATTAIILYPKNKKVLALAVVYALYIGFGASISFHWLSDCIAGAIIGTVIGTVVGKAFKEKAKT